MRVIAGTARRTMLVAPPGDSTRPTADRAKEGLFNILAATEQTIGARFLDLFCGSGAIGIEALSRGAAEAVFVDYDAAAIKAARANLAKTRLPNAEVLQMTAEAAIARLSAQNRSFDVIFLDPPYDSGLLPQTLEQITQAGILAEGGVIIAETDAKDPRETPETRTYGRTKFLFYKF